MRADTCLEVQVTAASCNWHHFKLAAHAQAPPKFGTEIRWACFAAGGKELLEEMMDKKAEIVQLEVEKEAAKLRTEELEALLEAIDVPQKRGKRTRATEQEQLTHELQASLPTVQHAHQATWSAEQCSDSSCSSDVGCNRI